MTKRVEAKKTLQLSVSVELVNRLAKLAEAEGLPTSLYTRRVLMAHVGLLGMPATPQREPDADVRNSPAPDTSPRVALSSLTHALHPNTVSTHVMLSTFVKTFGKHFPAGFYSWMMSQYGDNFKLSHPFPDLSREGIYAFLSNWANMPITATNQPMMHREVVQFFIDKFYAPTGEWLAAVGRSMRDMPREMVDVDDAILLARLTELHATQMFDLEDPGYALSTCTWDETEHCIDEVRRKYGR